MMVVACPGHTVSLERGRGNDHDGWSLCLQHSGRNPRQDKGKDEDESKSDLEIVFNVMMTGRGSVYT